MIDVNKAKQKILDLAIRGKLTKQLKSDGNAADLLVEIQKEKEKQNIGARKTQPYTVGANSASPNTNNDSEMPFEIPDSWVWCRFDELYDINPEVIANNNDKAAFIPMEKIGAGYNNKFDYIIQDWEAASKAHTKFCDGDVCFAKISPCFENRKSFIANNLPNGIGAGTTELIVLRQNKVLKEFTYLIVLDERFIFECSKSYKGVVGQQRIKREILENYLIPLPPLAEQNRIVEIVDKLFEILDKIDESQKKYQKDKEILKSKIIEAGIRGKLTKQLKTDGNASDLLDEIRKEKEKLIEEGKIKLDKKETYIYKNPKDNLYYEKYQDGTEKCINDELPFEIPDSWVWCRLENLCDIVNGFTPLRSNKAYWDNGDIPWFTIEDIRHQGRIITKTEQHITKEALSKDSKRIIPKDSVLLCCTASVGEFAYTKIPLTTNQQFNGLVIKRCYKYFILPLYLFTFSQTLKKQIIQRAGGTTFGFLSVGELAKFLVSISPLSEQKRIINIVENLLAYIDD